MFPHVPAFNIFMLLLNRLAHHFLLLLEKTQLGTRFEVI